MHGIRFLRSIRNDSYRRTKKEIKKYGVDIDKLIKNGDVNEVLFAIDDVILDLMDEDGELDKEGVKLQLIYDQIYNAN